MTKDGNAKMQISRADLEEQMKRNIMQNMRLGAADVKLLGDRHVLVQIVKLLAYIRHAIQSNQKASINVKIGEKIANSQFMFDVNQLQIDDLITQPEIIIC